MLSSEIIQRNELIYQFEDSSFQLKADTILIYLKIFHIVKYKILMNNCLKYILESKEHQYNHHSV